MRCGIHEGKRQETIPAVSRLRQDKFRPQATPTARSGGFEDFDVAVGVGELELAAARANRAGERFAADGSGGGDGQLGRDMAERGARGDVVTHAARDAHANGGEGSLQRDVAAAGGGLHSGDGNGAILIAQANAPGDRLELDSAKGSVEAGVAFDVAGGDGTVGIFDDEIAGDALDRNAAEAGLGVGFAADVGERDTAIAGDGADALRNVGSLDGAERSFQRNRAAGVAEVDFAVGGFGVNRAGDGVKLDGAEGIADRDGRAGKASAFDTAVVGGDADAAAHVVEDDAAEAVGDVGSASDVCEVYVAV